MKGYVDVDIKKPVYGNFVYIRDKYIKTAIREDKYLRITVPSGVGIISPQKWMKDAKRHEQIFKLPTVPMILWGNTVPVSKAYKYEIGEDGVARVKDE